MTVTMLPNKDQIGRAASTAVVAGGLTRVMDPGATVNVPMLGRSYPLWAVSAGCGAGASLLADYMHDTIIAQLDSALKFEEMGSTTLALVAGGGGYAASAALLDQRLIAEQGGFWRVAGTGALAVSAGHWIWNQISEMDALV